MTELRRHIDAVRSVWKRTMLLAGLVTLAADAVVVVLALVAVDAVYHLSAAVRMALFFGGTAALAAMGAIVIARPLRRIITDADISIYVENRFPELQGTLATAVEYEARSPGSALESHLVDALMVDCLQRAARIDLAAAIDKRRLRNRAIAAGVLLAFFFGAAIARPGFFGHALARVLMPWAKLQPTPEELAAEQRRLEAEMRRQAVLAALRKQQGPVTIDVSPGDIEITRGASVAVQAVPSRVTGPLKLRFRTTDGAWRALEMREDPAMPERFGAVLADITEDLSYQVEMAGRESAVHTIRCIDVAQFRELRLVYHYPQYTRLPEKVVQGFDGNIEAVVGTRVDVTLIATGGLSSAYLVLDGGARLPMSVNGSEATVTISVDKDGEYMLAAADARGRAIEIPSRYAIRAIPDEPPKLEVVYPSIDKQVHPLEEAVFAAKAQDAVGLKEIRLHYFYNTEPEQIERVSCLEAGIPATERVAEMIVDLAARRSPAREGDTILFHIEAEDTKGQVASSDVYAMTVRAYESFVPYGYHPVMGAHGYSGPELINIIAAAWHLHTRRHEMPPEKFNAESEKIGRALEPWDKTPDTPPGPRKLQGPKGVELTPEQQALLDEANRAVEKGHILLVNEHAPGRAVDELRKALAIMNQLGTLKAAEAQMAGIAPGDAKGTPHDRIESEGGMERIVEIAAQIGIGAADEVDNGLYKRKIVKEAEDKARKIQAEQKALTEQLVALNSGGGSGEQRPDSNRSEQAAQQQGAAGQQQQSGQQPSGRQDSQQSGQQQAADQQSQQAAGRQSDQGQSSQQTADQSGEQNSSQQAAGRQSGQRQSSQQAGTGKQTDDAAAQEHAQGTGRPSGRPAAPQQTGDRSRRSGDLAARQEDIARALSGLAASMGQADNQRAAGAFRDAAAQAANTARQIRQGNLDAAVGAARRTEKSIEQAMAEAGKGASASLEEAIAAVQRQLEKIQADQHALLRQTRQVDEQQAGRQASGGTSDRSRNERLTALAGQQARLKQQVEDARHAVEELAGTTGSGNQAARTPENAARGELAAAAAELARQRPERKVVSAAMQLAQGDAEQAARAMADVETALEAARGRVAAAADALAGGEAAQLEAALRSVSQLAAAARRLEETARAVAGTGDRRERAGNEARPAAGGQRQPDRNDQAGARETGPQRPSQNRQGRGEQQPQTGDQTATAGRTGEQSSGGDSRTAQQNSGGDQHDTAGEMSATWGQVLNRAAAELGDQVARAAGRLSRIDPDASRGLQTAVSRPAAFERDFALSLARIRGVREALEKVESDLQKRIGEEAQKRALRDYRRDEVPGMYRRAVADYYEELSKTR